MKLVNRVAVDEKGTYLDTYSGNIVDGVFVPRWVDDTIKDNAAIAFLDISSPANFVKPVWNGDEWEETATPEEIETARPVPPLPSEPTREERLQALETAMLTMMMGGVDNV